MGAPSPALEVLPDRLRRWLALAVLFAASLSLFAGLYRGRVLYDADSFYHLAIAREIATDGLPEDLEALRFSALADGFGDKEVLFHVLLFPFAGGERPDQAGRWALALLAAGLLTTIGALAARAQGTLWTFLPLFLVLTSTELCWRLLRLRPELLAVTLLLWGLWAAGTGRHRWVGVVGLLFTLSYTAFHAYLGLFFLIFAFRGVFRRRWDLALPLYALLGVIVGLLVHPRFPANLEIWVLQSLDYFQLKEMLEVGDEIRPNFTDVALLVNLGLWLGLLGIWRSAEAREAPRDRDLADAFGIAALAFGMLYLLMSRFSIYALPLLTLYLLFELRARGKRPGARTRLAGARELPLVVVLAVALLLSLPEAARQLGKFAARTAPGEGNARIVDRERLAAAIPEGAHVAAPWRSTPIYLLWAPWARYTNVLDPVFMARPHPREYGILQAIWEGREPDVPWALQRGLDSTFLALSLHDPRVQGLLPRLRGDPRIETRYRGFNGVFEVLADRNDDFVLDWEIEVPGGEGETSSWFGYPRDDDPKGAGVEGFVNALRLGNLVSSCLTWRHRWEAAAEERQIWEVSSLGPLTLWVDGRQVATELAGSAAILGRGWLVGRELEPGPHEIRLATCPSEEGGHGFYLLRRSSPESP